MTAILTVDGYDLQPYLRVASDDGLDPVDADRIQPQFGEAAGGEGDPLISIHEGNAEHVWPLHLTPLKTGSFADTVDGLHAMVTDLNRRLAVAALVEWRMDGATASTFKDVRHARFEPDFNYRKGAKLWVSGVLRVWAKPYGHTGTSRIAASAAGTGVAITLSPTTLDGDAPAHARVRMTTGSLFGASPFARGRVIGYAVVPSGRTVDFAAAAIELGSGATLTGQANAAGSQVILSASYINTGDIEDVTVQQVGRLSLNASQYAGRQRILAVAAGRGARIWAQTDDGQITEPVDLVTPRGFGFELADIGSIDIDPDRGATRTLTIYSASGAPADIFRLNSGARRSEFNRLLVVPDDAAGLVLEESRALLAQDEFGDSTQRTLASGWTDHLGNTYDVISGEPVVVNGRVTPTGIATVFVKVPARTLHPDLSVEAQAALTPGVFGPNGSPWVSVLKWAGATGAPDRLDGRIINSGTAFDSILQPAILFNGSVIASIAAVIPPGGGQTIRLRLSNRGPQITLNLLYDGNPGPTVLASLGASIAAVATIGRAGFAMRNASQSEQTTIYALESTYPATSPAPADTIVFDTSQGRVSREAASGGAVADLTSQLRGGMAKLGPARAEQLVAISAPLREQASNDLLSAEIRVTERFTYAR